MKKKIIVAILLVVIIAAIVLFVKMNYKEKTVNSDGEVVYIEQEEQDVTNENDSDEAETVEDILAKNDFKSNNDLQIQSLKSYNDGDSLLLEGGMVLSFEKAYIFFGGTTRKEMKTLTGVKDKYLKNLKEDESLMIVLKNGEPKCVITDDDGILFTKSDDNTKNYLEFSPSTVTILELKVEDGVYKFAY